YFNSRRAEFVDAEYREEKSLLLPKRGADQQIDVRWWFNLFGQKDEDMNVPRPSAVVVSNLPAFTIQPSSLSLDDTAALGADTAETATPADAKLRETKSTPALSAMQHDSVPDISALGLQAVDRHPAAHMPPTVEQSTISAAVPRDAQEALAPPPREEEGGTAGAEFGDPLGVTTRASAVTSERLDFASFASHNAFRD
ncbi:phosphatidylinositol-3-phosphatase ymr1, partial [Teratosphaeriaceae sp. CCFEE 6253]